MRSSILNCIWLLVCALNANGADLKGITTEERIEIDCSSAIPGHKTCRLWFPRLAAIPEKFHLKVVDVTGFLAVDKAELALYASESDYDRGIEGASVRLVVPEESNRYIKSKLYNYVRVVGVFNAKAVSNVQPRLGTITAIGGLDNASKRPHHFRETEVGIRAEDLGLDDEDED